MLNDGPTRACDVAVLPADIEAKQLWPRHPPIRFRKHIPTTWLAITLTEGRNRQVKRMCAAVGFPVLRLVRVAVGGVHLLELNGGQPLALGASMPISVDRTGYFERDDSCSTSVCCRVAIDSFNNGFWHVRCRGSE